MIHQQLLTRKQVCELLQVPKRTLQLWMHQGEIPFIRIGRRSVRFDRERLDQWLKERENMPVRKIGSAEREV